MIFYASIHVYNNKPRQASQVSIQSKTLQTSQHEQSPSTGNKLTLLRVPFTHTLAAAATTLDRSHNAIHVRCSAPLLVRQDVNPELLFAGLDLAHVGEHAFILEGAGEFRGDGGVGVQSGKGDQLQDESVLSVHSFSCSEN